MVTNVSMVLSAVYTHSCVCVYLVYVVPGWKGSRGENQCVWVYITVLVGLTTMEIAVVY